MDEEVLMTDQLLDAQVRSLTVRLDAALRVIGRLENGWTIEHDGCHWWYVDGGYARERVGSDEVQAIRAGRKGRA